MHIKINPQLIAKDKLYGTTTVGAKGQVVIPAEARKDLRIKPGDHLLVLSKHGKALGLIKSEDLKEMIETLLQSISEKSWREKIKQHINKTLGDFNTFKKGQQ